MRVLNFLFLPVMILNALLLFFLIFVELKFSGLIKKLKLEIAELEAENKLLSEKLDSEGSELLKLVDTVQLRDFALKNGFTERND